MSFRGLFVFKLVSNNQKDQSLKTILIKCYPTVEVTMKDIRKDYIPLPSSKILPTLVLEAIGLHADRKTFIEARDSCAVKATKPIFTLRDSRGEFWPLIVLEEDGCLFCCLAADYSSDGVRDIFQKSIADGFDFLRQLINFYKTIQSTTQNEEDSRRKMTRQIMETYAYIATACPFGSPLCCEPDFVSAILNGTDSSVTPNAKLPTVSWRPGECKTKKKSINLFIQEFVQAFQHENTNGQAICFLEVTGEIMFQCEVGGAFPEIALNLKMPIQKSLTNCLFHPLCSYTDYESTMIETSNQEPRPSMVIRFVPPQSSPLPQRLLGYHVSPAVDPPIAGFYQMRVDEATATLLLRLRLSPEVVAARRQNFVTIMEVQLPFPGRTITELVHTSVSQGIVGLHVNKSTLVWNVGTSLPKSAELNLSGKVTLSAYNVNRTTSSTIDQMCIGQNAYAQIRFKFNDYNYSNLAIDSKAVHCSTEPKVKVTIHKTLISKEYRIWNSLGDTPIVPNSYETTTTTVQ